MHRRVYAGLTIAAAIAIVSVMSGGPAAAPRPSATTAGLGWTGIGDVYAAKYGASVAGAGDVNGDGYADVLVGSYQFNAGMGGEGRVQLHLGSPAGPIGVAAWTATGTEAGAWLGYAIAGAGDVNGDGYDDVLVGAPLDNRGGTDSGEAVLYYGAPGGLSATPDWSVAGALPRSHLGKAVAGAGDVNADGFDDVIVGAPNQDGSASAEEGRAYLYLGSAAGLSTTPAWIGAPGVFGAGYGQAVAAAGDVNGDGFADVLVGAPLYDAAGFYDQGRVFVYPGGPGGLPTDPSWSADSLVTLAHLGQAVAGAGDSNGDGFADILVGAPDDGTGRAYVHVGSTDGIVSAPDWSARSRRQPAAFGGAVAGIGDYDLDTYPDIAIGAPLAADRDQAGEGYVYLYSGGPTGLPRRSIAILQGNAPGAAFGAAVAAAGDVNGDGVADLIVGAPGFDNGYSQGRVFVYFGGEVVRN